jgi:hypothetical protein
MALQSWDAGPAGDRSMIDHRESEWTPTEPELAATVREGVSVCVAAIEVDDRSLRAAPSPAA